MCRGKTLSRIPERNPFRFIASCFSRAGSGGGDCFLPLPPSPPFRALKPWLALCLLGSFACVPNLGGGGGGAGIGGGGGGADPGPDDVGTALATLTGTMLDEEGAPIADVMILTEPEAGAAVTDALGFFRLQLSQGWRGSIRPIHPDYFFDPSSRNYDTLDPEENGQDFTGRSGGDGGGGAVGNLAPSAGAGPDLFITLPNAAALRGSASDDGLPSPPGRLTALWSKRSGPGAVIFTNAASLETTATIGQTGLYVLRLSVTDGELISFDEVTVRVQEAGSWAPPVGIPEPSIGIRETHEMYEGQTFDFGNGPEPYRDAGNGPYTHYVDNTHPSATDTNNSYGTASRPRLSFPNSLPPGSVVEIHGGPYVNSLNANGEPIPWNINGNGETDLSRPVFFRGAPGQRPRFGRVQGDNGISIRTSGIIVENIDFDGCNVGFKSPVHHAALRYSEIHNNVAGSIGFGRPYTEDRFHDIAIFQNNIHHNGNYLADIDEDVHGIAPGTAWNVWILENEVSYCSGNGVQATDNGLHDGIMYPHHLYIGRNVFHHNKQKAVGIKDAEDVVISQNVAYGQRPIGENPSDWGDAYGAQYTHFRIWFLLNEAYDCEGGIRLGDGAGDEIYILGNLFHNIHYSGGDPDYDFYQRTPAGAGLMLRDDARVYACNNTIYDADVGITTDRNPEENRSLTIRNNAIANIREGYHISVLVNAADILDRSDLKNNLLYTSDRPATIRWQTTQDGGVVDFTLPEFLAAHPDKGEGCIEMDALFVDAGENDFHLQAASPCVDAGNDIRFIYDRFFDLYGIDISKDFDANSRPGGAAFDIGAFER